MTRRQDITLAAAITVWLVALAFAFLAAATARFDPDRCGRLGGCPWMQTT